MNPANPLHQILLQPTDVLFFRDGRPMSGSLAGHTAAWPLPDVTNHALHAALHRADLEQQTGEKLHTHRRGRSGQYSNDDAQRDRKFGSLLTAGPFPVQVADKDGRPLAKPVWFFPRPKDAQLNGRVAVTFRPVRFVIKDGDDDPWLGSSLPEPLEYAVANTLPPSKDSGGEPWISAEAYDHFLCDSSDRLAPFDPSGFLRDADLADTEQAIGIAIDPVTGTTGRGEAAGRIYSAHYLRLREEFRLGLFAEAMDKRNGDPNTRRDLISALLNRQPQTIIVGGQQRLCTAERRDTPRPLPLPQGMASDFNSVELDGRKRWFVKWVLLTPAIWPEIPPQKRDGSPQNPHPGGWLPNWVFLDWDTEKHESRPNDRNGEVLLTSGPGVRKAQRTGAPTGSAISARLVAAIVSKPIPVTGWAVPNEADRAEGGAKSTHLAVPAGAVYYFEAEPDAHGGPGNAVALAAALNWHGSETNPTTIQNRRSTLLGEKGYGLGVCGTWDFL
jgi:CRISPR-associated protein Cmr3